MSQVGAGGMAAVYKAYQTTMDRHVAVKVLPRSMAADPQFTARFENEARLLARLQHPHILAVFDFGQVEGYAYFVMPLVETGTLAQRLHGRPLPLELVRTFVSQIGGALDYAHSRALVHRDIKPSNVLVDESENYLLTDFGIAKLMDGSSNLTATGTLIGTPAYMSPEQGQGRNLDRRSDIYSLGVMIYELATGRVPFKSDTPIGVIFKHVSEPLPPAEALNPSLPPDLVAAINRALAKQPEDRFQTAGELVDAVEASIDETPEPRLLAATVLESVPAAVPPPVYNSAPSSQIVPPQNTLPPPPPSYVGGGTAALTPPPRRSWLGALLGLGGLGVVGLAGLAIVACVATYIFFPQVLGLPASADATRTAPAATPRPTRVSTDTPEPEVEDTDEPDPTDRPPTRTPAPPDPTVVGITDGLYSDDFEDSASGWDESDDDSASVAYVDGEYAIYMAEQRVFMTSVAPAGEFANVHLAVTARAVDNPTDAPVMGFMCQVQESGEYYYLGFSVDGYYGIVYYDGEAITFLTNDKNEWLATDLVSTFDETYLLEADCHSDGRLRLSVDGVVLADVIDTRQNSGGVGLFAASFDEVPVEVRFDDFDVTESEGPEVLLAEDFSSAGSWWVGSDEDHAIDAIDGRYVIDVYSPELLAWGNPELELSDTHLSVTVWNEAATTEVGFGVICNYQVDTGEYHYLGVGSDGYYAIGFYDGEATNVLTSADGLWVKSDDIAIGDTVYQVEADCGADGTLRLMVDGVEIATVTDDTYTSGDIGLFVQTWAKVPVNIAFDDLLVTALE